MNAFRFELCRCPFYFPCWKCIQKAGRRSINPFLPPFMSLKSLCHYKWVKWSRPFVLLMMLILSSSLLLSKRIMYTLDIYTIWLDFKSWNFLFTHFWRENSKFRQITCRSPPAEVRSQFLRSLGPSKPFREAFKFPAFIYWRLIFSRPIFSRLSNWVKIEILLFQLVSGSSKIVSDLESIVKYKSCISKCIRNFLRVLGDFFCPLCIKKRGSVDVHLTLSSFFTPVVLWRL